MSNTYRYCRRVLVIAFLGIFFIMSPRLGYAQERLTESLGDLTRTQEGANPLYESGTYTVPDGKTLVMEHVYIEVHVPAGAKANGRVTVKSVTPTSIHFKRYPFLFTSQGTDASGKTVLTASNPIKLYVINRTTDPATITVKIEVRVQNTGVSSGTIIAFAGYLEPTTP